MKKNVFNQFRYFLMFAPLVCLLNSTQLYAESLKGEIQSMSQDLVHFASLETSLKGSRVSVGDFVRSSDLELCGALSNMIRGHTETAMAQFSNQYQFYLVSRVGLDSLLKSSALNEKLVVDGEDLLAKSTFVVSGSWQATVDGLSLVIKFEAPQPKASLILAQRESSNIRFKNLTREQKLCLQSVDLDKLDQTRSANESAAPQNSKVESNEEKTPEAIISSQVTEGIDSSHTTADSVIESATSVHNKENNSGPLQNEVRKEKRKLPLTLVKDNRVLISRDTGTYMDQYEVSVAMYKECVIDRACYFAFSPTSKHYMENTNKQELPMNYINANEAEDYCRWRGGRLPTIDEWKLAAYNGLGLYPWGNEAPNCELVIFSKRDEYCNEDIEPVPVTQRLYVNPDKPLYHLSGNVAEIVVSRFTDSTQYFIIGGSYGDYASALTVSGIGEELTPDERSEEVGFRCVYTE